MRATAAHTKLKAHYARFDRRYRRLASGQGHVNLLSWFGREWGRPEVAPLMASFQGYSVTDYKADSSSQEWNPFTQRPAVLLPPPAKGIAPLEFDFASIEVRNLLLVSGSHEATHVLLLEPFFTGRYRFTKSTQYVELALLFEAFCFWYSDIIITRKVREAFPDGEIVFSRNAVSMENFHPYRAFQALGIHDKFEILRIYLDAFSGRESPLFHSKDLACRKLTERLYSFYRDTAKRPARPALAYELMKSFGVFDVFFRRFCKIDGLPTLLPNQLQSLLGNAEDAYAYFLELPRLGFRHLSKLESGTLAGMRARRSIQSRAYFALALRQVLTHGLFLTEAGKPSDLCASVEPPIEQYLDSLEELLRSLASRKRTPAATDRELCRLDQRYERDVRAPLKRARAWMNRVAQIIPPGPIDHGLIPNQTHLSAPKMRSYVEGLHRLLGGHPRLSANLSQTGARALSFLLQPKAAASRNDDFIRAYNRFISDPAVVATWSKRLDSIDPLKNSFRELLFNFA